MEALQIANVFVPGAIITIILGLLVCFFGYKIKKLAFFILGFIVGYGLGQQVPEAWYASNAIIHTILPFLTGILISLIAITAERICISLIVGIFVFFLAIQIQSSGYTTQSIIIAAIAAAVAGAIAGALIKPASIIATAIIGAYYVGSNIISIGIPFITTANATSIFYIVTCALAVLGMLYQFKKNKGLK